MWKFIIFILIAAVAVWQLNNIAFNNDDQSKTEEKNEEVKQVETKIVEKPKEATSTIKLSALQGALKGIQQDDELEAIEEEPKKVVEPTPQPVQKTTPKVPKSNSYEAMLSREAETQASDQSVNAVAVEGGASLGALVQQQQPPQEKVISLDTDKKQAAQLETLKSLTSETVKTEPIKVATETAPEVAEPIHDKASIRENLKKLLASAEQAIESDDAIILMDVDDTQTKNTIEVKTKSSKELLRDLVAQASNNTGKDDQFVANLLKEVSASSIRVLAVEKDATTVMVKTGDTLSILAEKIYGDAGKYMIIYEANKDVISNPHQIYIGMVLKMPRVQ